MSEFLRRLKERKLVQWALAYVAAAFALLQGIDIVASRFGWPEQTMRFVIIALSVGFFATLVLAWYHGERGAQRVTGTELLILALLLSLGGGFLWQFAGASHERVVRSDAPATRTAKSLAPAAISEKSIAVLPFTDLSAAHDQEYFGDGLAEELLNVLVQIDGLSVASRTSSFAFKGKNLSVPAIAQALGVGHIVEGSVRKVDDRLRITAQLIDVATDRHLWSQTFDRQATDVFAIQGEIARAIAGALQVRLVRAAESKPGTGNVAAYDLYLLGLYHSNQRTEEGLRKALEIFREATERDPSFARAFAGLSMTYSLLPGYAAFDSDLAKREALMAARKAVALDPKSAEALTALAQSSFYQGKLREALEAYDRAVAANPRYAVARHWKGMALNFVGRLAEAEAELRAAHALDPASLPAQSFLSSNLAQQGRLEEALAEALDVLRRAPDYRNALHQAFVEAAMLGRAREYAGLLERYFRVIGENPILAGTIVSAIEKPALLPAAIAALEPVARRHGAGGKKDQMAALFALLKAESQTLDLLEHRDYEAFNHSSLYDFLRGNPRYEALLAAAHRHIEEAQKAPGETPTP